MLRRQWDLRATGLFALNSYENRVYQLGRGERALVLKFYRPARWSDAQIIEEHAFATELAGADLPVAAPVAIAGETLLRFRDFRFAAFPWQRGRAPELDAPDSRAILGRSLARIHQVGAARPFVQRAHFTIERLGWQAARRCSKANCYPRRSRIATRKSRSSSLSVLRRNSMPLGPSGIAHSWRLPSR